MEGEARYMRRKVKAGLIEADHAQCAIVVHYEVEATVLGDMGEPIVAERQENTKVIKLKTLGPNTNIPRLAQEMVEKCKLIHASKLPYVETLLQELKDNRGREEQRQQRAARRGGATPPPDGGAGGAAAADDPTGGEKPSLARVEEYIERMYEGIEGQTSATYLILQLARSPDNLEPLLQHESLLGLLSRLLKEEGRKSMDLAINVVYVLYSFSNFSQFHPYLLQAHVGDNIMRLLELETKRHAVREKEREKSPPRERGEEKRQKLVVKKQEKLLYVWHAASALLEPRNSGAKFRRNSLTPQPPSAASTCCSTSPRSPRSRRRWRSAASSATSARCSRARTPSCSCSL